MGLRQRPRSGAQARWGEGGIRREVRCFDPIILTLTHTTWKKESEVAQSCLTLCNPMDCSPLGSSIHGIFQATILEWVVIFFSSRSSQPRDQTQVSCIAGRLFTLWATRESHHTGWPLCYTKVLSPLLLKKKTQIPLIFSAFYVQLLVDSFFFNWSIIDLWWLILNEHHW